MRSIIQIQAPALASGTPAVLTLGIIPVAGDIVVATVGQAIGAGGTPTISDSFGDTGGTTWAAVTGNTDILSQTGNWKYTTFWRVVGTGATGKTVTGNTTGTAGFSTTVDCGEYYSSDSGSWGVNGTAVSATGSSATPNGGTITTTANAFLYVKGVTVAGGTMSPGNGFQRNYTGAPSTNREANEWMELDSASNTTDWTMVSSDWMVMGAAFAKVPTGINNSIAWVRA
jgi:hypothetical protein